MKGVLTRKKLTGGNCISYLVCHMEKYHRKDVIGIERENERDEHYKSKVNPQIDSVRTRNNYHIIERSETYLSYIDKRIRELASKRKIKDDAVLINSFILGSDREFFASLSKERQKDFFPRLYGVLFGTLRRRKHCFGSRPRR